MSVRSANGSRVPLLVLQMPAESGVEVGADLRCRFAVSEGPVDFVEQRCERGVFGLHGVEQREVVGATGDAVAQHGPQQVVFGLVVLVQHLLEQLPSRAVVDHARNLSQVASQRVVEGDHHRHVELGVGHGSTPPVSSFGDPLAVPGTAA